MDELLVLKSAIQKGDLSETKTLILSKVSLSRSHISEAFLEAIKGNKAEIFEYFIEEVDGLNLRYSDAKGRRALHYAVDVGNGKMVKELLKHGATICYNDNEGYQAVHIATKNGDVDMLTFLINHGANISSAKTVKDGYTPIHIAALSNQPQALKVLIERSGSVNIQTKRNSNSLTPLHLAVKAGYEEIVEILCAMNACLDLADIEGKVPLHYAADRGYLKIMKILRTYGASLTIKDCNRRSILHYAVCSKSNDCVQFLIDSGAEVNEPDLSGHTPLIAAVVVGSADIVGILLTHGADVNVRGPGQETPLLLAASAGYFNVIKNLLDAGADVLAVNRLKETVLHKCQKISHDKRDAILELLVRAGAELNVIDSNGFTPLHNCAFQTVFNNFTLSTLKILVEAGASMTQTESLLGASRHSSLCWFVWREHFEAATYLIHSGWNLYPETWMYLPGKSQEQDLFHQWMRDICKDAPSLTQLCRGVIRHHFITCTAGREVSSSLSKLEIPRTLKDFLMLKA